MPAELRPMAKRKSTAKAKPQIKKMKKVELIEKKLEILEEKEKIDRDNDEKSNKGDNDSDEDIEDVRIISFNSIQFIINLNYN